MKTLRLSLILLLTTPTIFVGQGYIFEPDQSGLFASANISRVDSKFPFGVELGFSKKAVFDVVISFQRSVLQLEFEDIRQRDNFIDPLGVNIISPVVVFRPLHSKSSFFQLEGSVGYSWYDKIDIYSTEDLSFMPLGLGMTLGGRQGIGERHSIYPTVSLSVVHILFNGDIANNISSTDQGIVLRTEEESVTQYLVTFGASFAIGTDSGRDILVFHPRVSIGDLSPVFSLALTLNNPLSR